MAIKLITIQGNNANAILFVHELNYYRSYRNFEKFEEFRYISLAPPLLIIIFVLFSYILPVTYSIYSSPFCNFLRCAIQETFLNLENVLFVCLHYSKPNWTASVRFLSASVLHKIHSSVRSDLIHLLQQ